MAAAYLAAWIERAHLQVSPPKLDFNEADDGASETFHSILIYYNVEGVIKHRDRSPNLKRPHRLIWELNITELRSLVKVLEAALSYKGFSEEKARLARKVIKVCKDKLKQKPR